MEASTYRRALPEDAIEFASPAGKQMFAEALAAGGLDGYFALAEQFHTQAEPAFCGLGSLVVALNALAIDPGRSWKGPWRWFSEELLDCCVPLEQIRERGIDLDELACLARCNGARVELTRAEGDDERAWRAALVASARGEVVVIAAYDRAVLGQTGQGHYSPIGGYSAARDAALVLDVARFKYPPHWIGASRLWAAMRAIDPATSRSRGWLALRRGAPDAVLGFSLSCGADGWRGLAAEIAALEPLLATMTDVGELARLIAPLGHHVVARDHGAEEARAAVAATRVALHRLALYAPIVAAVGSEGADAAALLVLAFAAQLAPRVRTVIAADVSAAALDVALAAQLAALTAQAAALGAVREARSACADRCAGA